MKEVKKCLYCGKEFKIWPSRKKKYCSIKCYQKTLKGSGNPNYNNKWTDKKKKEASMIKKEYFKNNKVWNKGLTIETDERVKKYAETQKGQKRKIKWTKEAIIKNTLEE